VTVTEMTLRGRPRLDTPLDLMVDAVRRHRQVMAAARELGCSPAYVHKRLKAAKITLAQVLKLPHVESCHHG
jgi:hypothetical protein